MATIKLTKDKVALIDDEDFDYLDQWKWTFSHGYAVRNEWLSGQNKGKRIYLHRFIMNSPKNKDIDHVNGVTLDNTRKNLRITTHSQNLMNRDKNINNTSGYKGIYWDKSREKWVAAIKKDYKFIFLGRFNDIQGAVLARKNATIKYFGEFSVRGSI